MTRRVLITGAGGCLGRQLAAAAVAAGDDVIGLGRHAATGPWQRFVAADVGDGERVRALLAETRPDVVFHLAGGWRGTAQELFAQNVAPVTPLAEALHAVRPDARLVCIGSAAEYGPGRAGAPPFRESDPCTPDRAYGVSKYVATTMALACGRRLGLRVAIARPSNLLGPGLSPQLAIGAWVAQLAAHHRAGRPLQVRVGDLRVERDFVDVEDVATALLRLAARTGDAGASGTTGEAPVCNLAAGVCVPLADVLDVLQRTIGSSVDVVPDPALVALPAPPVVRLANDRARALLDFAPRVPLAESLARMWRAALAAPAAAPEVAR